MTQHFTTITTVEALETTIETSAQRAVIVFQHDPICPTSRRAYQHLLKVTHPIAIVDVSRDYAVKRALATCTGIRHESPQVIVFKQGMATWSASHGAITQQAVEHALREDAAHVVAQDAQQR